MISQSWVVMCVADSEELLVREKTESFLRKQSMCASYCPRKTLTEREIVLL
jgi:hypothetical protein